MTVELFGPARALAGRALIEIAVDEPTDLPGFLAGLQSSGELSRLYHDQDVLNLRFRGDWLRLDPLWNLTKPHPALRALDPYIVHYTTGMKPWNRLAYVAFGSSYRHVMTRDVLVRYRRYLWRRRLAGWFGRRG